MRHTKTQCTQKFDIQKNFDVKNLSIQKFCCHFMSVHAMKSIKYSDLLLY